ncbi:PREDICTED: uncharacterized protein LOC109172262 isoform X1 [Ipomoea nil]|uniref:uncharacterized protein LOC109172262 isoform X1 n=2 Tax=Ipomoea nil TaxID=35883 RepID=UPI0009010F3F|nr:PREDICTED: uncharacterized protein LOC109172262 isoform X1 [Ipomoea nil]
MKGISSLAALSASLSSLRFIRSSDGCGRDYTSSKIVAKKSNNKSKQPPSPKGSEPPRITSNLKQNLQFIKLGKEIEKKRHIVNKAATRYRKKKAEKEELPEDTELYSEEPALTPYYNAFPSINEVINTAAIPVLLVDGYNVCGFWAKLKKHFLNGKLDIARQKLIDELVTFSTVRELKVVVVFDAMMSGLPFHKETFAGVDVVYSTETCADAWIEKEAADLRRDGYPEVWVVTSDLNQQIAAYGAGAFVWSCKTLVSEIKTAEKELERMLREQRSTSMQGKLLKHNLDPDVVTALKDLRDKLSESESRKNCGLISTVDNGCKAREYGTKK